MPFVVIQIQTTYLKLVVSTLTLETKSNKTGTSLIKPLPLPLKLTSPSLNSITKHTTIIAAANQTKATYKHSHKQADLKVHLGFW